MAVDDGDCGRLAVGEFSGEAEAEAGAVEMEFLAADFVEEARAVAEDDGKAGDGIPDDIAETAQAGEGDADLIPVGV